MKSPASQYADDIDRELHGVPPGDRGRIVARWAAHLGCSTGAIYRHLASRKAGSRPRPPEWPYDHIMAVAAIRERCRDKRRNRLLPIDQAIRVGERAGGIPSGAVTVSTYSRAARALGLNRPKAVVRFEATHSNQSHQADVSGSDYLYPERTREGHVLRLVDLDKRSYKNKPPRINRCVLWICQVVDDHSRAKYARYFIAPSESAPAVAEVLLEAWGGRQERRIPLAGIPEYFHGDNGPFRKSKLGRQFLKRLGVGEIPSAPYNPRARGKVERAHRTLFERFELALYDAYYREGRDEYTVEELNELLITDYVIPENERAHPLYRDRTRTEVYLADRGAVRLPPEDPSAVLYRESVAHVRRDRTISVDGDLYLLPGECVDQKVRVYFDLQGRIACELDSGQIITPAAFKPDALAVDGEHIHAMPASPAERVEKAAKAGRPPPRERARAPVFHGVFAADTADVDGPFTRQVQYPMETARARLGQTLGQPYSSLAEPVRNAFEELVRRDPSAGTVDEAIDRIAAEIEKQRTAGTGA